jgi:hypothetical protein
MQPLQLLLAFSATPPFLSFPFLPSVAVVAVAVVPISVVVVVVVVRMYGESDKDRAVHKAIKADLFAPKRKHVRSMKND